MFGKRTQDGLHLVDGLLGVLLQQCGISGREATFHMGNIHRFREQLLQGRRKGFAVEATHKTVGIVVRDAILLETVGQHLRRQCKAAKKQWVEFDN
ncbi:MAG: DUF1314 domain-containing protein [Kiritimatiellae bacterium]|nr:DUF1314 domain-containing protein [Kiritimatiellia bacterium]